MKKTTNFHLSQWDKTDRLMMDDFNADNGKIDAALAALQAGKADAAPMDTALAELDTKLSAKSQVVTGSYTGTGAASRGISLGFQPKAVALFTYNGATTNSNQTMGGLALPGVPVGTASGGTALTVTATGFTVYQQDHAQTNVSGYLYRYLAIR